MIIVTFNKMCIRWTLCAKLTRIFLWRKINDNRKNVYSLKTILSILGLDLHNFKILTSFLASVGRIFSVKHDLSMTRARDIQTARQTWYGPPVNPHPNGCELRYNYALTNPEVNQENIYWNCAKWWHIHFIRET